jgi:hypothetical protein
VVPRGLLGGDEQVHPRGVVAPPQGADDGGVPLSGSFPHAQEPGAKGAGGFPPAGAVSGPLRPFER